MSTNERLHKLDTNQSLNTYYYDKTFTIFNCFTDDLGVVGRMGIDDHRLYKGNVEWWLYTGSIFF